MSDDLNNPGPEDGNLVDVTQKHEVSYWKKKFGCTKAELVEAVEAVGTSKEAVASYLASKQETEVKEDEPEETPEEIVETPEPEKDEPKEPEIEADEPKKEKDEKPVSTESLPTVSKPSGNTEQKTPSKVSGNIVPAK